jgi:hypothetical protein
MRTFRLLAPFGAAAVLAVAGCSGDTDREPTAVEASIIDGMAQAPSEDADPAETEAARNEMVAACMAEADLEYLGRPEAPSQIEWLGLTPEQFGAQYGFGHTTTIDLAPGYQASVIAAMEEYQASLEALPESERERYRPRELDCLEESYAEFGFPENGSVYLPNDSPIHEYTAQAAEATAADPRLAAAAEAWSACMLEQGYDFDDRDEMGLPLQEEGAAFAQTYATQGQALIDAGRTWEDLSATDVLDAEQLAALEALQQRELDIYAADQHCIDQGHDLDAVYSEVYDEQLAELIEN